MASISGKWSMVFAFSWLLLAGGMVHAAPSDVDNGEKQPPILSGVLEGMGGSRLVLELNGTEKLTLVQDGEFVFQPELENGSPYAVRIAGLPLHHHCEVENGEGTFQWEKPAVVKVACRPTGAWRQPSTLQDSLSLPGQEAREPAAAVDDNGNGIVAWTQFDGRNWRVYLAEFREDKWQRPVDLSAAFSPAGGDARQARVAVAANGDAVVAWEQRVGERSHIYLAEKREGKWRKPASLDDHVSPGLNYAWEADVAMADDGSTILVWDQEYVEGFHLIYKSEYRQGVWRHPKSSAEHLAFPGGDGLRPRVAMNNRGEALISWEQDPGGVSRIYKSEYRRGTWSYPAGADDYISPGSERGGAYNAIPALNDRGEAVIAWQQAHDTSSRIYKSEYRQGVWRHPKSLDDACGPPPPTSAMLQSVAMDREGSTILLWILQESGRQKLYLSEYRNSAWKRPRPEDFLAGSDRDFDYRVFGQAAMSDTGKAFVGWQQMGDDKFVGLYLTEYFNGEWYRPGKLINPGGNSALSFAISASRRGNAILAWQQSDGKNSRIYGSVFRVAQ